MPLSRCLWRAGSYGSGQSGGDLVRADQDCLGSDEVLAGEAG